MSHRNRERVFRSCVALRTYEELRIGYIRKLPWRSRDGLGTTMEHKVQNYRIDEQVEGIRFETHAAVEASQRMILLAYLQRGGLPPLREQRIRAFLAGLDVPVLRSLSCSVVAGMRRGAGISFRCWQRAVARCYSTKAVRDRSGAWFGLRGGSGS